MLHYFLVDHFLKNQLAKRKERREQAAQGLKDAKEAGTLLVDVRGPIPGL